MKILAFAGSARRDSLNKKLARVAAATAKEAGAEVTLIDLDDYPIPLYHGDLEAEKGVPENARKLKALMQVHNGIFFAAPEYNAGVAPLLKNAIDWVSRVRSDDEPALQVYTSRVFALASASPGRFGGARGLLALRHTLELGLGALVLPDQLTIAAANDAFDERGHLKDKALQSQLKALIERLARASKPAAAIGRATE